MSHTAARRYFTRVFKEIVVNKQTTFIYSVARGQIKCRGSFHSSVKIRRFSYTVQRICIQTFVYRHCSLLTQAKQNFFKKITRHPCIHWFCELNKLIEQNNLEEENVQLQRKLYRF